jgi:arylsulfatase A-like enzyme
MNEDRVRHLRHGYLASVSYIDAQIGRLLDALDRLGLRDNTIVVLWGDHGWKIGEHRSFGKMTNFEVDARVPLIVAAPNAAENGRSCDGLVEFVDLYPTLSELAGLPIRPELEGTSFAPLLSDRRRGWKSAAFTQFLREGIWVAPDGVEYMGRSIRTDRYRYVEWRRWTAVGSGLAREAPAVVARELYDHRMDPLETVNVAGRAANAAVIERLAQQLRAGWRAARPAG